MSAERRRRPAWPSCRAAVFCRGGSQIAPRPLSLGAITGGLMSQGSIPVQCYGVAAIVLRRDDDGVSRALLLRRTWSLRGEGARRIPSPVGAQVNSQGRKPLELHRENPEPRRGGSQRDADDARRRRNALPPCVPTAPALHTSDPRIPLRRRQAGIASTPSPTYNTSRSSKGVSGPCLRLHSHRPARRWRSFLAAITLSSAVD